MLWALPGRRFVAAFHTFVRATVAATACVAFTAPGCRADAAGTGPSVRDVVEFTRIVYPEAGDVERIQAQVSPDGTRAFIVTRKANTRADRNRYQILMLDMRPSELAQGRVRSPDVLLSLEPELDNNAAYPSLQDLQWAGPRTILFRARLGGRVFQGFKVDTVSRRMTQLTHSPTDVVSFAISADLRQVVYTAQQDNPPMAAGRRSVVVGNQSFWSVKFGQTDMRSQRRLYQHFVAEAGSRAPARRLGDPFTDGTTAKPPVSISPDGRWALLPRYEPGRQLEWSQSYPLVADATARLGPAVSMDPLAYYSRPSRYVPRRLVAFRVADAAQRPLLDAPDDTAGAPRPDVVWQDGGRSVIVAGTHLPLDGVAGQGRDAASHAIEYWPDTGRWKVVAELKGRLRHAHAARALADGFVLVDDSGQRVFRRGEGGAWQELSGEAALSAAQRAWSLRLQEDLDVPPDAVAQGPEGQVVRLTELNPQVTRDWGSMQPYAWKDAKGREWSGGLMLPAGHQAGARLPLVIQTYGFARNRFYLDGANTAIGYTSGFAGRAFLREHIAVLAVPVRPGTDVPRTEAAAIGAFNEGVRGAIEALVAEGVVDRDRIGIMGWSMTGERVLNLVTFSDAPIRAATILDGDANTLFSLAVTYGHSDDIVARKSKTNEGLPFGEGHANWMRNDPALHTECVRAALRIETYGPWVLNNWDIHALMRQQYKPVEMVVIPGGSHGLMTPSERMISLQGNVDWFRFWLRGEERTEPLLWGEDGVALKEQYRQWHQMVGLKKADDARPACARKRG
jgi:dipeptidyl aminopeptidase/acylaminoacyl peptidase